MTMCLCGKHGRQACGKVSKLLSEELKKGNDISTRIRDFSFLIDDIEWPFFGLEEEVQELPERYVNDDFLVETEERLGEVLDRITVVCLACLKEAMHGARLPVRETGR